MTRAECGLIRAALKFAVWACGEGIGSTDPDEQEDPDTFLMRYADASGEERDWETLHEWFPPLNSSPKTR